MKFLRETNERGLHVLTPELKLAGFSKKEEATVHVMDDAVVILKHQMSAIDIIRAINGIKGVTVELMLNLAEACGSCDDCEEDYCSYEDFDFDEGDIELPVNLLDEAGITEDDRLCGVADREKKTITIYEADYKNDLSDIPPDIMDLLVDAGICLKNLERLLVTGEKIYED